MKFRLIVIIFLVFAGLGCDQKRAPAPKPNVLMISVDTLRRDHLGCYGYKRSTTPNIDALAKRGTVFDSAISSSCWTLPSHASMLTGLYPAFHGLQDDGVKLSPGLPTLAEQLKTLGYNTLAVVSHVYVSSQFGVERGFDRFDDSLIEGGAKNPIAEDVVDRFLEVMAEMPPGRFFGFVHFFDPHWDYEPPAPFDTKFTDPKYKGPVNGTLKSLLPYFHSSAKMPRAERQQAIALYDGEIAYVDAQIGRLLKALQARGKMENTLVVFTADHGEEFKDHGMLGHGKTLFGEQIQAPLIMAGHEAFEPGSRRSSLASPIDIAPTLIELAGGDPLEQSQGESLLADDSRGDRAVFSESIRFGNETRSARMGQYKLLHIFQGNRRVFYDLRKDPRERHPSPLDPTGGKLTSAFDEYTAAADSGWHLKFIALATAGPLRCRGTVQTSGRILDPKRFFSGNISGPSAYKFNEFELSQDQKSLTFELMIRRYVGEITFETEPLDAPITLTMEVDGESADAGVFLGKGVQLEEGEAVTLRRSDARLFGLPHDYARAAPGCYVRAVVDPSSSAPKSNLSKEAVRRLRALGYVGSEEESKD